MVAAWAPRAQAVKVTRLPTIHLTSSAVTTGVAAAVPHRAIRSSDCGEG